MTEATREPIDQTTDADDCADFRAQATLRMSGFGVIASIALAAAFGYASYKLHINQSLPATAATTGEPPSPSWQLYMVSLKYILGAAAVLYASTALPYSVNTFRKGARAFAERRATVATRAANVETRKTPPKKPAP